MRSQCPLCGTVYEENFAFCKRDGAQLVAVTLDTGPAAVPGDARPLPPPPPPAIRASKLYDTNSVGLATFLGSPLAGSILMALNYRRLKKPAWAFCTVVAGLIVTGLAGLLAFVIPQGVSIGVSIGLLFAIRACAQGLQGRDIEQHRREGGSVASAWAATGIALAVAAVIGAIAIYASLRDTKITVGSKDEIYYSGSASEQDAGALGRLLKEDGFFSDRGATVMLSKDKGGTVVSFMVQEGTWHDQRMIDNFQELGREIAPTVGGFPIKVRMANTHRETQREMTIGRVPAGSKDEVFYYGSATEADGKALAEAFTKEGFLADRGASVMLAKGGDNTSISFVVKDGAWEDPQEVAYFERLVRAVAASVGGLPIKLRLVDSKVHSHDEVPVN
jgi:hypothetical protein